MSVARRQQVVLLERAQQYVFPAIVEDSAHVLCVDSASEMWKAVVRLQLLVVGSRPLNLRLSHDTLKTTRQ